MKSLKSTGWITWAHKNTTKKRHIPLWHREASDVSPCAHGRLLQVDSFAGSRREGRQLIWSGADRWMGGLPRRRNWLPGRRVRNESLQAPWIIIARYIHPHQHLVLQHWTGIAPPLGRCSVRRISSLLAKNGPNGPPDQFWATRFAVRKTPWLREGIGGSHQPERSCGLAAEEEAGLLCRNPQLP